MGLSGSPMYDMQKHIVEDYMTKSPVVIDENATLKEAWELLEREPFTHLPVIDADGVVCGILSETDLHHYKRFFENLDAPEETIKTSLLVKEVMSAHLVTISPGATIQEANDLLLAKGVRALPVTEEQKIIGIISETDILRYYSDRYK